MSNPVWCPSSPSTVNWNFPKPMQIQVTTQINANNDYRTIAKDFIEKFASANTTGVGNIGYYYNADSLISLHIHQGPNNFLFEITGYNNLKIKFAEMGIHFIKYDNIVQTAQPLGKNNVLLTIFGRAEINGKIYNIMSTFIIKIILGTNKITNQIFNIFM
jgi:hypothetical protein